MNALGIARFGLLLSGLILGLTREELRAQGTIEPLYVLNASGATTFQSTNAMLDLRGVPQPGGLSFAFGFTTAEQAGPGGFLDSFTISVADVNQPGVVSYFVVIDAQGAVVAPVTPGTVFVDPTSVSLTPIAFPASLPAFARSWAYRASLVMPAELADKQVNVFLDLFDNGDALPSLGWASDVVVIPEPSVALIGLVGLLVWVWRGKTRRV